MKIDANSYASAEEAIEAEMPYKDTDDFYIFSFGF
jgi:hypothetical protein